MAEKERILEVLGVEEDEEIISKITCHTYRVHFGVLQLKIKSEVWTPAPVTTLCEFINNPSQIVHKPRFTDEEKAVLRWLHKHAQLGQLCRDKFGVADAYVGGSMALGCNIAHYLLNPGETIDLDEMFKEGEDG